MKYHYQIMDKYGEKGFNVGVWPKVLNQNCLPFALLAHRFVARKDRGAKVIIGRFLPKDKSLDSESKNKISNFHHEPWLNSKPHFHAWIRLSDKSIYDVVGPKLINEVTKKPISDYDYLDQQRASEAGYIHHEVLTERQAVRGFYKRLRLGQIFQWQERSIENISDDEIKLKLDNSWYLTKRF